MSENNNFVVALKDLFGRGGMLVWRGQMLPIDWYGAEVVVPKCLVNAVSISTCWVIGGDGGDPILLPDDRALDLVLFPDSCDGGAFTKKQLRGAYIAIDRDVRHGGKVRLRHIGNTLADERRQWTVDVDSLVPTDRDPEKFLFRRLFKRWNMRWIVVNTDFLAKKGARPPA